MTTSVYLSGRNVWMYAGILGFLPRFFQYLVFEKLQINWFLIAWPILKIRLLSQMFYFPVSGFQSLESGGFVSICVWSVKLYSQWKEYHKGNIFLWCKGMVLTHILICLGQITEEKFIFWCVCYFQDSWSDAKWGKIIIVFIKSGFGTLDFLR